jgi:hypothetical protein
MDWPLRSLPTYIPLPDLYSCTKSLASISTTFGVVVILPASSLVLIANVNINFSEVLSYVAPERN